MIKNLCPTFFAIFSPFKEKKGASIYLNRNYFSLEIRLNLLLRKLKVKDIKFGETWESPKALQMVSWDGSERFRKLQALLKNRILNKISWIFFSALL